MCGFAGVVAFDRGYAVSRPTLQRMSDRIAHRGPDGEGIWMSPEASPGPRVALAHRRLAILDLDPRSNQPFTDGRHWLVFNGEIYNFRELRKELSPREWKTTCDTEVLLAAYDAWGEDCVSHLNGMFAFAIWDSQAGSVFLARDRMGQKPLFFAIQRAEKGLAAVAFASEIGGLMPVEWIRKDLSDIGLSEYLNWGYALPPRTVFAGIEQVEPAQYRTFSADGIGGRTTYFNPDFDSPANPADLDMVGETRRLMRQAVERQLVSDVPLGCFLSGGIDSSVIAAAMKAAVPADQRILTFSIGFDDPRYDETAYAAEVARHLETEHRAFTVRPDAAEDLPKLAAAFGEPMADSSALPTHYLARETRKHVKVALSGDGGDELFGGYDRYRAMRLIDKLGALPLRLLASPAGLLPHAHQKSHLSRLKRLARSVYLPEAERYASYVELMDQATLKQLLGDGKSPGNFTITSQYMLARQSKGVVESALAVDRRTYLPNDVLAKVDRCSMLHALEVRSPFLDHELVHFASGLIEGDLLGGGAKSLLRRAFAGDLPKKVFRRKKMGFAVPIGDWLRTSLRPMLHDSLFAGDSFAADHFNRPIIETMIADHQEKRVDHSQRLYALLMLELWWRSVRA
jgi:asparagine synthase (glutamine-hydrolysing)